MFILTCLYAKERETSKLKLEIPFPFVTFNVVFTDHISCIHPICSTFLISFPLIASSGLKYTFFAFILIFSTFFNIFLHNQELIDQTIVLANMYIIYIISNHKSSS